MTATQIFGGVASVASFIFFGLALIGQFHCTVKGKSYRTHVRIAGAIAGLLLLISLIWVDWGIGYGIFYTIAEIAQIFAIYKSRKAKDAEANMFEAGKTAGKVEAEALLAPQLAAAKAEGKAEGIADAEEKIRDLKVSIAEKEAVIRFYESKFKK